MVKNKWQANADRSSSGRISTKKTNTFTIDTAIRVALTGTSNPNDAVVGRIPPGLKKESNELVNTKTYNATRIIRSGGTVTPAKFNHKYLSTPIATEPTVPTEYTYTHLWYGRASDGSATSWSSLPTTTDGSIMAFGVMSIAAVYIITYFGTENSITSIYQTGLGTMTVFCANADFTIIAAGNGYSTTVSTDLGETWWLTNIGGNLIFASLTGGIMVSVGLDASDIYYSSSFGQQWNIGHPTGKTGWVSIAGADAGDIVFLANNTSTSVDSSAGGVWRRTSSTGLFSKLTVGIMQTCCAVWCSSTGTEVLAASTNGLVYYSKDTGATWSKISSAGAFPENVLQIRAGSAPVETAYVITTSKMYSLSLVSASVIDLSTPIILLDNDIVTISNIYIGSSGSNYSYYTISRDNCETQSSHFTSTTYIDTEVELGNTYIYSITYYTSANIAIITNNIDTIVMRPAEVVISSSDIYHTSFIISYTSSTYTIVDTDVFEVVAYPTSSGSLVYPDTDNTYNGYATFSGLSPGIEYTVRIIQTNVSGTTTTYFYQSTIPNPPDYVIATSATTDSITINITPSIGAISYTAIAMRTSLTFQDTQDYMYLTDITADSTTGLIPATITGLTKGRLYQIRVYSVGDAGWLDTTTATGVLSTLSGSPTNLSVVSKTTSSITISFTGVDAATSYTATILSASGTTIIQTGIDNTANATTGLISATLINLDIGTFYQITVAATNSASSLPIFARTVSGPPVLGDPYDITTASLSIPFTGVSGVYSYSLVLETGTESTTITKITQSPVSLSSLTSGATYTIKMYTINLSGDVSAESNIVSVSTIALPPTDLKAANITSSSMAISFEKADGASSYVLELKQQNTDIVLKTITLITASPIYLYVLSTGYLYSIQMFTVNNSGTRSAGSIVLNTLTLSASPTNLYVDTITTISMYAHFTKADGADSYTLLLTNQLTNVILTIPNITQSKVFLSSLSSGVNYLIELYTVNASGMSATPISLETITRPTILTVLTISNITSTSMYITYDDVLGADEYNITATPTSGTATEITTSNLYTTLSSLTPGMEYSIIMTATNSGGTSAPTDIILKTTIPGPTTLYQSSASSSTSGELSIPFDATILGADAYLITATAITATGTVIIPESISTSSSIDSPAILSTNITPGTKYKIVAKAYNENGYSGDSNTIFVYSLSNAPTAASIDTITTSKITISITYESTGATSYYIVAKYQNNVASYISTVSPSLTATLLNLSSGITYAIYIYAVNSSGTSTDALLLSGTTLTDAPTLISTSQITDTSFLLSYTGSSNAASYTVYCTPYDNTKDTVIVKGIAVPTDSTQLTGLSVTITGLSSNMNYTIKMVALNATSQLSSISNLLYILTRPGAPTLLETYTSTSPNNLNIYFTTPDGASQFILRYISSTNITTDLILYSSTSPVEISELAAGNYYTVKLFATNNTGTSSVSNFIYALTLPSPPTTITPTSIDSSIITLAYNAPTSATGYVVVATLQTTGIEFSKDFDSNSVNLTGLSAGTLYTIKVYSKNSSGTSITAISTSYSTIPAAPSFKLPATNITTRTLYVEYYTSFGATSYNVLAVPQYGTTKNVSLTQITANPVQVSGFTPGINYNIYLTAANASGNSVVSSPITALMIPAVPSLEDIFSSTSSSIDVNFTGSADDTSGSTTYFVSGSFSGGSVVIYPNSVSPIRLTNLLSGTSYTMQLYATNNTGNSTGTTAVSYSTIPATPANLKATSTSSASITLTFDASTGATSYYIYKTVSSITTYTIVDTITATISSLLPGVSYSFWVVAHNTSGNSIATSAVSYGTLSGVPVLSSSVTDITTASLTIWYTVATGALKYVATATPPTSANATITITDIYSTTATALNSVSITGLSSGIAYKITMYAINSSGNSGLSAEVSTMTLPLAPTSLQASAISGTSMTILYNTPTGGYTYDVYAKINDEIKATVSSSTGSATLLALSNNTTYTITATATNILGGLSAVSSSILALSAPAAPTLLVPSNIIGNAMTVSYTQPAGGSIYTVSASTTGQDIISATSNIGADSVSLSGLLYNTTYTISAIAKNANTVVGTSLVSSSILALSAPAAPTDLTPTDIIGNAMTVSYTQSTGGSVYTVSASATGQDTVFATSSIGADSVSLSGLLNNTTYTLSAIAKNANTVIGTSFVSGSKVVLSAPAAPTITEISNIVGNAMTVSYTQPDGGSVYTVSASATGQDTVSATSIIGASSVSLSGLLNNTTYTISAIVKNANTVVGTSFVSGSKDALSAPAVPTSLNVSNIKGNAMTVSYTRPDGGLYFIYTVSATIVGQTPIYAISSTGASSVSLSGLLNDSTYTISATAKNSNTVVGTSFDSGSILALSAPAAPTLLQVSSIIGNTMVVSYTMPVGTTDLIYTVRASATNQTPVYAYSTTNSNAVSLKNLVNNITYTIIAFATNDNSNPGVSVDSSEILALSAPAAPTDLQVSNIIGTSVKISYTRPVTDYTYTVYAKINGTIKFYQSSSVNGYVNLTGLTNNTTYTITAIATNNTTIATITTTRTSVESVALTILTAPVAPTLTSVTAVSAYEATAVFTLPTGSTGYTISATAPATETTLAQDTGYINTNSSSGPITASLTDLVAGTTYTITVYATNASNGTSLASSSMTVLTKPDVPAITSATPTSATTIDVVYTTTSLGATYYKIIAYITSITSLSASIIQAKPTSGSSSSVTLTNLVGGTTYNIVVYAQNASGDSVGTDNETVLTYPVAPTVGSPSSPTYDTMSIPFTQITGLTYKYTMGTTSGTQGSLITVSATPISLSSLTGGTSYTINLYAVNTNNNYSLSTQIVYSTRPAAPTVGSPSSPTYDTMSIPFTVVSGLTYKYTMAITGGTPGDLITVSATPISLSSLTGATSYTNNLYAFNTSGDSLATTTTYSTIPSLTSVSAYNITSTTMGVNAVGSTTNITGYLLTVSPAIGSTSQFTFTTLPTSLSSMLPATNYTLSLIVQNASGNSVAQTTSSTTILDAPTVGDIVSAGDTSATVSFTEPAHESTPAITYAIVISPTGGVSYSIVATSPSTTITGLATGTLYSISMTAKQNSITSLPSTPAKTYLTIPTAPSNLAVSGITSSQITVTYTSITTNSTTYILTVDPAIATVSTFTPTGGSITLTGMTSGTTYSLSMKAHNESGDSAASVLSSTTLLDTPVINTVTADTDTSLLVYYTGVSGADSYVLTISPATGVAIDYAPTNASIVSPSTGAIAITGLASSTTYVFSMKAKKGTDTFSAASGTQSYTTLSIPFNVTIGTPPTQTTGSFTYGGNTYSSQLVFKNNCTGSFPITMNCFVLMVGGGGGGGGSGFSYMAGGGGGAGKICYGTRSFTQNVSHIITIGNGGAGGVPTSQSNNGNNTVIKGDNIIDTAFGGGGGGSGSSSLTTYTNGKQGGSGGGSSGQGGATGGAANSSTNPYVNYVFGYKGGSTLTGSYTYNGGSGGGGAIAAGNRNSSEAGASGGAGVAFNFYSSTFLFGCGGGGGGVNNSKYNSSGGAGGYTLENSTTAGNGGNSNTYIGGNAISNSGSGGGGAGSSNVTGSFNGGSGASGIVIILYR